VIVMDEAAPAAAATDGEDRIAAWLAANPGAKAWQYGDGKWHASCPIDSVRHLSAAASDTEEVLAARLPALAAACAEVRLIEAEFPGWLARRWSDGTWRAIRPLGPHEVPVGVWAPDTDGLRAKIRLAEAALAGAA
jgi:hypothetical protein